MDDLQAHYQQIAEIVGIKEGLSGDDLSKVINWFRLHIEHAEETRALAMPKGPITIKAPTPSWRKTPKEVQEHKRMLQAFHAREKADLQVEHLLSPQIIGDMQYYYAILIAIPRDRAIADLRQMILRFHASMTRRKGQDNQQNNTAQNPLLAFKCPYCMQPLDCTDVNQNGKDIYECVWDNRVFVIPTGLDPKYEQVEKDQARSDGL